MDVLCMDKTGTLTNESILLEYYMDVLGNESGHEQHFSDLLMRYQKEDEIPFDYSRKFVSTLVTDKNGDCQLIMKGNISQIVSRCSHVEFRGEILPMEKNGMQSVASVVDEMLQDGMKVIAVARKKIEKQDQIIPTDENNMILMGYLAFFDAPKKTAMGQAVSLTPKEFDILYFLAENRGEVFTKEQIYKAVWSENYLLDDSNIMAFIRKLRKKIEPNPDEPKFILTI